MSQPADFRPFVPTLDYPRVAAMHGRDADQHAAAAMANPVPRALLIDPWEQLYNEPFRGITTDGHCLQGLFRLGEHGAPTRAMFDAATALMSVLSPQERKALLLPIDDRQWRRWNNTEMYLYPYGLRLDEVSPNTRDHLLGLMRASLSAPGFEKTRQVMRFNHFLGELALNTRVLGEWSYNMTLFGAPSTESPWGWQITGHHLALNCLVIGGQMVLTPAFMGAEPNHADVGPLAGQRLFEDEERGGLELMRSLTDAQRERAILYHASVGGDLPAGRRHRADQLHLGGAFQDNRVVPYEGVAVKTFTRLQRQQLLDLSQAYIAPLPNGPRTARIEEIERHLDHTHFCWIGGTAEHDTFYYRIQSPVVMIEFDHHSGVFLTNELPAKFHVHTIVRTPNGNDYGKDLLRLHHARDHHPGSAPGRRAEHIEHRGMHHHADGTVHADHDHHADHGEGHTHPHPHHDDQAPHHPK